MDRYVTTPCTKLCQTPLAEEIEVVILPGMDGEAECAAAPERVLPFLPHCGEVKMPDQSGLGCGLHY